MIESAHESVLLHEAVSALVTDPAGNYIDGTFGRGGHAGLILDQLNAQGHLLAIDRDPQAIAAAARFSGDARFDICHGEFSRLAEYAQARDWSRKVCGVLLDVGVSSPQLDEAERGFSFMQDGPLDMRMNPQTGVSAREWLAGAAEEEIANVIWDYGEERFSRRMARAITRAREEAPIETTAVLAKIVADANPAWEKGKHPATRAFQGIRIFINDELGELKAALAGAMEVLAPGGRIAVISFHSLEDRIVKRFFRKQAKGESFPRSVPVTDDMIKRHLKIIGKAVKAGQAETEQNVRARSAVLRVAEKLP